MNLNRVCQLGGYPNGASLKAADATGEARTVIIWIRLHCAGVQTEITWSPYRRPSSPRLTT